MRRSIVQTIWHREVRDQLRDRRTVFMVVVLPILLYPALTLLMLQFFSAFTEKEVLVGLVGDEYLFEVGQAETKGEFNLERLPPLLAPSEPTKPRLFHASLFGENGDDEAVQQQRKIHILLGSKSELKTKLGRGEIHLLLEITPEIVERIRQGRRAELHLSVYTGQEPGAKTEEIGDAGEGEKQTLITSDERTALAYDRLLHVLQRWERQVLRKRMERIDAPDQYHRPIRIPQVQMKAEKAWYKFIPFMIVMMSLTGALYPAIDVCAGEKERGTMETLLISPASRSEIVAGKFLTVWIVSTATAILNLVSLGFTAFYVGKAMRAAGTRGANSFMPEMGPEAIFWCLALLVPLAAFFSAVCLGLALFARSTKEGQYFLMPVTLVTMPLTLLSILPGVNLKEHPVYAILPITGPTLLMQSLMNMKTLDPTIVLHFFAVILPLIAYCYLALHWAVAQFNSEEVLFREAERLDLKLWLHRLLREKEALPSASMAMSCFALIMLIRWFLLTNSSPNDNILRTTAAGLLVGIALPPLMMAFMLTMRPDHSLLLRSPRWYWFFFGIVFAVLLHPVVTTVVNFALQQAPTIKEQVRPYEEKLFNSGFGLPAMLFTFALLPAVCEELAFRGFVLMGLLRRLGTGKAVLVSSLLFAIAHLTAFQFLPTFLIGLLLGYLALRSGSVYPGMILHALHNGLVFAVGFYIKQSGGEDLGFDDPLRPIYTWPVLTICSIIGLFLGYLLLFRAPDSVSVLIEENQDTVDCPSLG